jgi:hypothetical protein
MRLEVIGLSGETLFDSDFKPGNVIDWPGSDSKGQRLADGAYLCIVSVTDSSGQLTRRQAIAVLRAVTVSVTRSDASQAQVAGPPADEDVSATILEPQQSSATAILAHDGATTQLISSTGGLSISSGDFFSNKVSEHIRLTAEGNVGIGVANPQAKLDNAPSFISFRINNNEKMSINSLGQTTMGGSLEVSNIAFNSHFNQGNNLLCYFQLVTGEYQIDGCGSSIRLKKNIDPFTFGLSLIKCLRPVSFDWKSNGKRDIGLIAEDVDAVEPLLATRNDKGEVVGVKYEKLPVVLINAVKEQQAQLEQQQAQITLLQKAALARHNAERDARLRALEQQLQQLADQARRRSESRRLHRSIRSQRRHRRGSLARLHQGRAVRAGGWSSMGVVVQ